MPDQPRPVWLDEEEMLLLPMWVRQLWVNAPSDPTKAVAEVLDGVHAHGNVAWLTGDLDTAVLLALGYPRTEQA